MSRNDKKRIGRLAGFTLVEMLLVITIIGILAAVVVTKFAGRGKEARISAARASIAAISTAIEAYEVDMGTYPSSMQSLVSSSGEPNWKGPYIRGGLPVDPWGTPFGYSPKGDNDFEVRSAGPDRAFGTADDVTSFTNE